jgi:hypothetical protein
MAIDWLNCAPRPTPLASGEQWHVFLSYRSVSRAWVLPLYDVLRQLGYSVFLDQYVLSAAAPLALSLSEALGTSRSAVMVWSAAFEDSNWCMTELNTLITMEQNRPGFRYVIAKIDAAPLPAIAAGKIYVDFAEQRDGATGAGLLRLLYGLSGEPLSAEAVKAAADYDDRFKAARASIAAARAAGDALRLKQLAARKDVEWETTPALGCQAADALIALKECDAALDVVGPLIERFPRSLRPKQLEGLARARKGDWQGAQLTLGELYAAGEIDPETLGIYARTWMDRYNATGNRLFLLKSRDLYRQAFEAAPKDYYTGINAASKSLLLGERETAAQLGKRVEAIVGTSAKANDYWQTATVAEVQLLQGKYAEAGQLYGQAVGIAPLEVGAHESSWKQAQLLSGALGATDEQRGLLAAAFAHLEAPPAPV